jgi:glycosyltransferase involved in cell wall biosynthesis
MRVLQVIDSLASGGAETSLAEMAAPLVALGVDLHVAYLVDRTDVADRLYLAGATLWPLTSAGGRLGRVKAVRRLVMSIRPDVVHTTLFEADLAGRAGARLAGVPVVSSLVNEMYGQRQIDAGLNPIKLRLAHLLDWATSKLVISFHAISNDVAHSMGRRLRISADRITVIPRGRDLDRLGRWTEERRRAVRSAIGLSDETPVVLAVAREEPQKGLDTLLRAIALLARDGVEVRLLIAGRRGAASDELDQLTAELDIHPFVSRLGRRDDIADLMVGADALAFPSRWEGMGGTLIEALALECPIVCSDLPVLRETVRRPEFATFVPVDDAPQLAAALSLALSHRRDREVGAAARLVAEHNYAVANVARSMISLYELACGLRESPLSPRTAAR